MPRRIPGPSNVFPLITMRRFRRDPVGYLRSMAREYGPIVKIKLPGTALILVNEPEYIYDILVTNQRNFVKGRGLERAKRLLGEGLLTSEGDFHLRQRRMMQPSFHRHRIVEYGSVMSGIAERSSSRWKSGDVLDISEEAAAITLTIVGKTLFDADVEGDRADVGHALRESMELFNILSLPGAQLLEKLPLPAVKRFRNAKARLDSTIYRIIDERRGTEDRGDLLSTLLAANDEEGGGGMTDLQVRDEAMTLFLAGHETTANALGWMLYLLSQNPDVEEKIGEELDRVLGGRLPGVDDMSNLRYVRQVVSESLRLYPPAWIVGRRALDDYPIGDYVIERGSIAVLAEVVTHVDPRFWVDPMRFDPDRWANEEEAAKRPKFAYFPFGGGPRICIGENFAWMELVLVLSTLLQRWRFRLAPGQVVEMAPIITLRPKRPIRMEVSRRNVDGRAGQSLAESTVSAA